MITRKYRIVVAMIMIIIMLSGCDRNDSEEDSTKETTQFEKKEQIDQKIQELSSKYKTIVDWRNGIDKKELSLFKSPTYTIEVEDALIRANDRPILFAGSIEDVVRKLTIYSVHFRSFHSPSVMLQFEQRILEQHFFTVTRFVLDCTPEQVQEIMLHRTSAYQDYLVVAKVSEVKKIKFEMKAYTEGTEDVWIDLESSSDIFIANGKCFKPAICRRL